MADTSVIFNILAKDNASSVFGKVGKAMSSVLMGTGFAVGNAALNQLSGAFNFAKDSIFGFNATLQNSQIAFTTMLGSGAKAQAFLADLQTFAKKTPFQFEGLVQSAQQMMGMGIAAKDVIPDLTALGDSVASVGGSSAQIDQVTLAFDQMAAKGTLDMGNMNQLLQGGVPNALRILADSYNVTTGQMIQMISTGKVQSAEALPKLIAGLEHGTKSVQGLGGMMDKQSQTFTGALSNIKDGLQQAIAGAFKPFFNVASSGAQLLGNFFSGSTFAAFDTKVSSAMGNAIDIVKYFFYFINGQGSGYLDGFSRSAGTKIMAVASVLKTLFTVGRTVFANIATFITGTAIPAGVQLAKTFGPILAGLFGLGLIAVRTLSSTLGPLGGVIRGVVGFVAQHKTTFQALAVGILAVAAAQKAWGIATGVWSAVTRIATAVQAAFNVVMAMNPIGLVVLAIVGLVAAFAYLWTHSAAFRNFWIGLWGGIKDAALAVAGWFAGPFVNFFVAAGQAIAAPFLWLWHNVLDPVWQAFATGSAFVGNILRSFANLSLWVWEQVVGRVILWLWHTVFDPAIRGMATAALWLWNNAISPAFSAIEMGARAVGAAATWLWRNAIEPAMHGAGAAVSWIWRSIISPVFSAITGANRAVGSAIQSTFSAVGGWIGSAFSSASRIVKSAMNGVIWVINKAIQGLNFVISLANRVPGVSFPYLPYMPYLASGGQVTRGGLAVVGERGAEVVSLPAGAAVYPHGSVPAAGGPLELRITGSGGLWVALREAVRTGDLVLLDSNNQQVRIA